MPTEVERVLHASWRSYCRQHIQADGRVSLGAQERETDSEVQAGALLRAVAAGDAVTFARVYAWTRINLSRRERQGDALLARRWGLKADGVGVILEDNTDHRRRSGLCSGPGAGGPARLEAPSLPAGLRCGSPSGGPGYFAQRGGHPAFR